MATTLRDLVTRMSFAVDDKPLEKLQGTLEKVQTRLTIMAGAQVLRGLFELTQRFSGIALDLQAASQAAGITSEQFQKLTYSAAQSGVGQEQLGRALSSLTKHLYDARMGSSEAAFAFSQAGIKPEQLASFSNSQEALYGLADSLKGIQDPILRTAAAQALLGESGNRLLAYLDRGSAGLNALGGSAEKMNAVVSETDLKTLADSERALSTIKLQVQTLAMQFAAKLAPSVRDAIKAFSGFLAANKALFSQQFEKWTYNIGYAMGYAYAVCKNVFDVILAFTEAFPGLTKAVGYAVGGFLGFKAVLGVIGSVVGIVRDLQNDLKLLQAIGSPLGGALKNAFNAALPYVSSFQGVLVGVLFRLSELTATALPQVSAALLSLSRGLLLTPVGAFAAGVVALVVACHELWKLWNGGRFKDTWLGEAYYAVKNFAGDLWSKFGLGKKPDDTANLVPPDGATGAAGTTSTMLANLQSVATANATPPSAGMMAPPTVNVSAPDAPSSAPVSIQAPVTINVSGAGDPRAVGDRVSDAVNAHINRLLVGVQASAVVGEHY